MESLDDFIERFRRDIEAGCGCPVYQKLLKDAGYHLRKHEDPSKGLFAGIWQLKWSKRFGIPYRHSEIQVSEEHAIKAGVANRADGRDDGGWWGKPSLYWFVTEGNTESYNRAVRALSKICQVR